MTEVAPQVTPPFRLPICPICSEPTHLVCTELDNTCTNLWRMLFICCNCGGISEELFAHGNIGVVEELAAAGYAKKVIDHLLLTSLYSSNALEMLRLVHGQARNSNWQTFSGDNEASAAARNKALLALNDIAGLMQARWLTRAKINKAK